MRKYLRENLVTKENYNFNDKLRIHKLQILILAVGKI